MMNVINAKKTPIAQAMSKPEGYILEDDALPAVQNEQQKRKAGYRKLKPGEGKKIALAILVFLIRAANKSIRYLPLMLFIFFVGILLIPADVLFEIKTEWQNAGTLNLNDFTRLLDMARTAIWNIWLLTFACVFVSDLHDLTFSKHNAAFGKTKRGDSK